jgi:hypothetical protein
LYLYTYDKYIYVALRWEIICIFDAERDMMPNKRKPPLQVMPVAGEKKKI